MNAEYFRDMLNSLEAQGLKLDKMSIRVVVKTDTTEFFATSGTCYVNVGEDDVGTFTIEAVPDE